MSTADDLLSGAASLEVALRWAAARLQEVGVETPGLDAVLLLGAVLGMTRAEMHLHRRDLLSTAAQAEFIKFVERRLSREPLAYILGRRGFYDIELEVSPAVLIPRPETELLVEEAIRWCEQQPGGALRAADIGTGSGAIAITLARHLPNLHVLATDSSGEALAVAARNVARYGLAERVHLLSCDLLEPVSASFNLVAANLPYIPSSRLASLQPEVRCFEPRQALDGGPDGLDAIARLCSLLPARLQTPALVLLEIDAGQGQAVTSLAQSALPTADVRILADYAGLERLARIELNP